MRMAITCVLQTLMNGELRGLVACRGGSTVGADRVDDRLDGVLYVVSQMFQPVRGGGGDV